MFRCREPKAFFGASWERLRQPYLNSRCELFHEVALNAGNDMLDKSNHDPERSELAKAFEVFSTISRGLPPPPENAKSSSYGSTNRVEDGVRLRDVWMAIRKRCGLIAGIVLVPTAITAVMMAKKPDIYMAEAE